jgi:hypothetical protein
VLFNLTPARVGRHSSLRVHRGFQNFVLPARGAGKFPESADSNVWLCAKHIPKDPKDIFEFAKLDQQWY